MRAPALRLRLLIAAAAVAVLATLASGALLTFAADRGLRGVARSRGLEASWRSLDPSGFLGLRLTGVVVRDLDRPDTLFRCDSARVTLDPLALLTLKARPASLGLWRSRVRIGGGAAAGLDTLDPQAVTAGGRDRADRLRHAAESLVRLLSAPARQTPHMELVDFRIQAGDEEALWRGAEIGWLEVEPAQGGVRVAALGSLRFEREVPFRASIAYQRDDRIEGEARLEVPRSGGEIRDPLRIAVSGRMTQDRGRGVVTLAPGSRITIGELPLELSGRLARRGPSLEVALSADTLTEARIKRSLPQPVLGPLAEVGVTGWWGYRSSLELDLSQPDSVAFTSDVLPHGLRLDPDRTYLRLFGLDQPFLATIHLPRGRIVTRLLDESNPHFRPLARIAPALSYAVVTNEDGGFFRHRGFNTEAVRASIAENLKAGAFRRGAGTITMQLARNLYLGHDRTLSRKGQEVVLAWIIEHLTGVSKERLLEIYLNIIEWGPDVNGADEAARFYFERDAGQLSVDQALFLATVIPAPKRWKGRFEPDGSLKGWARAQMHFIGRAMIAKGWLEADALPPAAALEVRLDGPARALLLSDTLATQADGPPSPI
jgi:hypothetical protein